MTSTYNGCDSCFSDTETFLDMIAALEFVCVAMTVIIMVIINLMPFSRRDYHMSIPMHTV